MSTTDVRWSLVLQTGGDADIEKYSKRTVRVTAQHNEECRRLLVLMGVPVIEVSRKDCLSL